LRVAGSGKLLVVPIYDYSCRACGHRFETLVLPTTAPACPACASQDLERLLSAPAVSSEGTRQRALKAARRRDARQAAEQSRAQRDYEAHHND